MSILISSCRAHHSFSDGGFRNFPVTFRNSPGIQYQAPQKLITMLKNFLLIALRQMRRNKIFSFINIAGLSVGVACCLILVLYVQDDLQYDRHHRNGDRLYRITTGFSFESYKPVPRTAPPIAWGIKDEIPEFEQVARVVKPIGVPQSLIQYEDKQFYETDAFIADSTLLDVLTYPLIAGNPRTALREANSVVIGEALAVKLFGNEPALNKVISISQNGAPVDFTITGIMNNTASTHLKANFFTSMTSNGWAEYIRKDDVIDEWAGQNFMNSYVRLRPGADVAAVVVKMNEVFRKHGADDLKALGMQKRLNLEPVQDIYMYSTAENDQPRIIYIYVVGSIAAFILLIACINFMNLSTAKASQRAVEVGLRKTLGAPRALLIRQFLSETLVIVAIALIISCIIIPLALPAFNQLTGKHITLATADLGFIAACLAAIITITGVSAGSYPAFYLSSFEPAGILKGRKTLQSSGGFLRRALVVFQFVIAITLVCGMIMVTRQLTFMQERNLGFSTSHKIVLPLRTGPSKDHYMPLRDALVKQATVNTVTATNAVPGTPIFSDLGLYPEGGNMDKAVLIHRSAVEPNYLTAMNLKLIAGKNFSEERNEESWQRIIVNEEGAKQFGFTSQTIVGQRLHTDWQGQHFFFEVIGVMEDYHQISLKEKIYPIALNVNEKPDPAFVVIELQSQSIDAGIAAVENTWNTINEGTPFEYTFLDETIQKQYTEDRQVARVINTFTIIAMVISCLGLYGLSTFMAEKRFKEIGVRKVMGASIRQIVFMMGREFVILVVIAFVIAVPLSLYGITTWLEGFAYKTAPDLSLYVLAGSVALLIAILTISFESIRAAAGNPVDALREQ